MENAERDKLLQQIVWDYSFPLEEIIAVLKGEKTNIGHYNREMLFQKIIESYSWFTVLQLFTPTEIKILLTNQVIAKLRSPSLRQKYEFVQKRLHQIIPTAG